MKQNWHTKGAKNRQIVDSGLGMLGEKRTSNAKQSELFTSIFIVLSNYNQLQDGNVSGTAQLHRGNHAGDHYVTHIQRNTWDTCTWWTNDRTEIKRLLPYFSVCKWVFSLFFQNGCFGTYFRRWRRRLRRRRGRCHVCVFLFTQLDYIEIGES